jgi:hypothetical protein
MARYRKLDVRMWADEKFRKLSAPRPNAQSLWVYLLAGPHTTSLPGLSSIGEAALAEALGWPLPAFRRCFRELADLGMVRADWNARVVWVPNAIRYNPPPNYKVVVGWKVHWEEIPECGLKAEALRALRDGLPDKEPIRKAFAKAFGVGPPGATANGSANGTPNGSGYGIGKGMPIQEQEQEQDTPLTPQRGEGEGFETVWEAYPLKANRPDAEAAWRSLRPDGATVEAMLSAIPRQAASERWRREGGRFIPQLGNWLSRRRWEDRTPEVAGADDEPDEAARFQAARAANAERLADLARRRTAQAPQGKGGES